MNYAYHIISTHVIITAVIGGGNRSTWRKPATYHK